MEAAILRVCPRCKRKIEPSFAVSPRIYSVRALSIIYYLCGGCRLMYINKSQIRSAVSSWRKSSRYTRREPFAKFYAAAMRYLADIARYNKKNLGYKFARFKKAVPHGR